MEIIEIILLIIAAFITSAISSVLGMGGGIILLGIMAIIIPEGYMVIALHGMIQLFSNSTRTYIFREHVKTKLIKQFFIGALIGVAISILIIMILISLFIITCASEMKVDILYPFFGLFIIWYFFL